MVRRDEETRIDARSDPGLEAKDADARASAERAEREEWLVDLVSKAAYKQFYGKKARGKHLTRGGVYDLLHYAFLAAAREGARVGTGVEISAGKGALERAKERLCIEATAGTLTTYTAHWNYLFAGYEEDGILSAPVKTKHGTFRVRFFMRGDKSARLFWLAIEDDAGNIIYRTSPNAPRVRLGDAADKLLVQQVLASRTVLTEITSWLRQNRRNLALFIGAVLTILLANNETRAAMIRAGRAIKEKVEATIRIITGTREPAIPISATPEPPPLTVESAPPTPVFDPSSASSHEGTADTVLPPGVWLDAFKPRTPDPLPQGYAPEISLNPETVSRAYIDIIERDPSSGIRRLVDRTSAAREYPDRENFGMNVVSSGAPLSTRYRLSFNARVTGPEWAMRPPKYIKWAIYRASPSGELLPPPITGLGRQVFAEVDSRESYAVLMEAETDISSDGRLYTQMGLALLQFDRGKWNLKFPGTSVTYDAVSFGKPFKRQVVAGRRWNEPITGQFSFLVFPGKLDRNNQELFFDFGDGTTTDRDYKCGNVEPPEDTESDWSEHVYACTAAHVFKTTGTKIVTVRILDKTIGEHPNHRVVEELSTTVNVTDVK